jgi:hypothetical protein
MQLGWKLGSPFPAVQREIRFHPAIATNRSPAAT